MDRAKCELMVKAVNRARLLGLIKDTPDEFQALLMDLDAVLTADNLADLLAFDDFSFTHDVCGIRGHLNRQTCRLGGGFLPRCGADAPLPDWWREVYGLL